MLRRADPDSLRSLVLGRALPLSLSTVQDVFSLSCRHPHHASSLSVASESAPCTSCGNCDNLHRRASSRVRFHKTFDCLASSSSRTFLPSRDRFSRLFPLPGRRAVLQRWRHGLHPSSTIETRTNLRLESTIELKTDLLSCHGHGLLCHCGHQTLLAVTGHVLVSASMMNTGCCARVDITTFSVPVTRYCFPRRFRGIPHGAMRILTLIPCP